ncbi:MAG: LysM peptidoglycan-binding domain-containing protein [bacterium]|nr:LysM peptidoglycan-binding domain-containing protein [bacterium]
MNELKKYFSESTISLILGIAVVLVLGLVAYKVFKGKSTLPANLVATQVATQSGELTQPIATVALPTEHTVKAGETLWSIAERYYTSGYNWKDIASVNGLTNANKIVVGQKLTIPNVQVVKPVVSTVKVTPVITQNAISGESYTVIKGDTLWTISVRAYGDGYRWKTIATANRLLNPRLIHTGNILSIPRP